MSGELKNVIVFPLGRSTCAVELRWVREVIRLGPVTPVPTAPDAIAGLTSVHGAVVPVLAGEVLAELPARDEEAAPSESALYLEVDGQLAAVPVLRIDAVTSLPLREGRTDVLLGPHGDVRLLDPPELFAAAAAQVARAAGRGLRGDPAP